MPMKGIVLSGSQVAAIRRPGPLPGCRVTTVWRPGPFTATEIFVTISRAVTVLGQFFDQGFE